MADTKAVLMSEQPFDRYRSADKLRRVRVLVVDDSHLSCRVLKFMVLQTGVQKCKCVASCQAAVDFCKLALSKNKLPDIVIMDYHLKNTTGPQAVRRIQAALPAEAARHIHFIGLTGDVDSKQVQNMFYTIGIGHMLYKPTTILHIKQTILNLLAATQRKDNGNVQNKKQVQAAK